MGPPSLVTAPSPFQEESSMSRFPEVSGGTGVGGKKQQQAPLGVVNSMSYKHNTTLEREGQKYGGVKKCEGEETGTRKDDKMSELNIR